MKNAPTKTLKIQPGAAGRFEVCEGGRILGTSQNEMMAVWTAVALATKLAADGRGVRVVRLHEGGEIEEFITGCELKDVPKSA